MQDYPDNSGVGIVPEVAGVWEVAGVGSGLDLP